MRVLTSAQMKQVEEASLDFDMTFQRLMENAGSAAAAFIRRTFQIEGLNCMIFCGSGNNGGDGAVVARKLFEAGANVLIVMVDGPPHGDESKSMFASARLLEIPITDFSAHRDRVLEVLDDADIIVDAVYGTGFHGALGEGARAVCQAINAAIAAVVALDIPSGVNCDSAERDPDAVRADFTIAFDSRKPVHILDSAAEHCGRVEVADIGIPPEAHAGVEALCGYLSDESVFSHLPPRDPEAHKGSFGRVLAVCGSARYRGAAALAAEGALRCGAGIVTLASTETVCAGVAARLPEATFLPLEAGERGGIRCESTADPLLLEAARDASSLLIGCGLGDHGDTARLLTQLLRVVSCPTVVDADGLNALAKNIHVLQEAKAPLILTPHPGEMARLCGLSVEEVQAARTARARLFAQEHGVVLVLKGAKTVVAEPDGRLQFATTGNAGLAKGGSGDLLAGMIAAFLAQGLAPFDAAVCAVHLHGLAADRCAARRSQYAMLPSELLDDLCEIFAEKGR